MNEHGAMTTENATLLPSKEKKKSRSHHKNLAGLKDSSSQNDDAYQEEATFERQSSEINDESRVSASDQSNRNENTFHFDLSLIKCHFS